MKRFVFVCFAFLLVFGISVARADLEQFSSVEDFSNIQGYHNWYYLDSNGGQLLYDAAAGWWRSSADQYLLCESWGCHPGEFGDVVRRWVAPQDGVVRIAGNARDAYAECGDGVVASVRKGVVTLWQKIISNGDMTGFPFDLATRVSRGDGIDFVVSKGEQNNWCDSTAFPAVIYYDSASMIVHEPPYDDTPFKNPGMGWVPYYFGLAENIPHSESMVMDTPMASVLYTNYLTWRDLEPLDNEFRWDVIDNLIDTWAKKGRKVKLGIHIMDPTSIPGPFHAPLWFDNPVAPVRGRYVCYPKPFILPAARDAEGKFLFYPPEQWVELQWQVSLYNQNLCEYEPYYWDSYFLEQFGEFVRALAAQYKNSPKWQKYVESFDVSTYGYWGEWWSDIPWPSQEVKEKTLRALVEQYLDAFGGMFPRPYLTMNVVGGSISADNNLIDGDASSVKYAISRGVDMVRRNIGVPLWMGDDELAVISDNIHHRRFFGEWGSCDGDIRIFKECRTGEVVGDTDDAIDMALARGASYLGWYVNEWGGWVECTRSNPAAEGCQYNSSLGKWYIPVLKNKYRNTNETREEYVQRRLGFRLYLQEVMWPTEVRAGASFELVQLWDQLGVAKMYDRYYLRAYLEQPEYGAVIPLNLAEFPADSLPVGPNPVEQPYYVTSRFVLPADIPAGLYDLKIAVVDATGEPAVNLAIGGKDPAPDAQNDPYAYGKYLLSVTSDKKIRVTR